MVVRKFSSFEEAEKADREYYRSLTGQQRLDMLVEMLARNQDEPEQGLARVYRIVRLGESNRWN